MGIIVELSPFEAEVLRICTFRSGSPEDEEFVDLCEDLGLTERRVSAMIFLQRLGLIDIQTVITASGSASLGELQAC